MKKFLIIDGSSMFYRAYYAAGSLMTSGGVETGAVVGFSKILLKFLREREPDLVAVALDVSKKTFRAEKYPKYKGNRKPMPDKLSKQLELWLELLEVLGIKAIGVEGYEADDVLGTLARLADKDICVEILTGDRDALQLIDDKTQVLLYKNKGVELYDTRKFLLEYDFMPWQLTDYKGLCGDSSDNLRGIAGVGAKTATALIKEYGTVEKIIKRRAEIKKLKKVPPSEFEMAQLCKELATIVTIPSIKFSAADYEINPDFSRADDFFTRYEMNALRLQVLSQMFERKFKPAREKINLSGVSTIEISRTDDGGFLVKVGENFYRTLPSAIQKIFSEYKGEIILSDLKRYYRDFEIADASKITDSEMTATTSEWNERVEKPLSKILAQMEKVGVYADRAKLKEKTAEMASRLTAVEKRIYELAGENFNVRSPKQLAEYLSRVTGMEIESTAAEVLREIDMPVTREILKHRELFKLQATYLEGMDRFIGDDGRVHTLFSQTATGRLSSAEPNMQNIPVRTAEGKAIREIFTAGEGYDFILSADYSQIELRVLAHMSGDKNLIAAFNSGEDIHDKTARELKISRQIAKAVNFGIIYGQSGYGLSRELKISRAEADDYILRYFDRYPEVERYLKECVEMAHEKGAVLTLNGRWRSLPAIESENWREVKMAERMAMNTPIQGTAAEIIKIAMIRAAENLRGMKSRMIMQVHDELIFEVTAAELEAVKEKVREAMEGAVEISVPLPVTITTGASWRW